MTLRKHFQKELKTLHKMLLKMTTAVNNNIDLTIAALKSNNFQLAQEAINGDDCVDNLEIEIETFCIDLLISQQPVATDLREVTAALKMITDIERISDYCSSVCERFLKIKVKPNSVCVLKLINMGKNAKKMFGYLIEGFLEQNDDKLVVIKEMDSISDSIYKNLETFIAQNFENIEINNAINFILMGRALEKMADHITNVCDWIHFKLTGKFKI